MSDEIKIIAEPSLVSTADADQILNEIAQVLRKHGCAIQHMPDAIYLGKMTGPKMAINLAKVYLITPEIFSRKLESWGPIPALTRGVKH